MSTWCKAARSTSPSARNWRPSAPCWPTFAAATSRAYSVHSLRRGAAEAIEVVAHGDAKSSKVIGRSINEIKLPPGTTIGALVRDEEVLIAHGDTHIESGDHVLLFLVDKKYIRDVERLFQAGLTFF